MAEILLNIDDEDREHNLEVIEGWKNLPDQLVKLSKVILERNPQGSLELIQSNDFIKFISSRKDDTTFDQLKQILLQLYDDDYNYISASTVARIILNPIWDPFVRAFKYIINDVNSYRYDNEIQFFSP